MGIPVNIAPSYNSYFKYQRNIYKKVRKLIKKILKEDEFDFIRDEDHDMDWIENTNPVTLGNDKPREGEYLMCLPGFHNDDSFHNNDLKGYGGAGYVEGRVIIVARVSGSSGGYIIWPAHVSISGQGLYPPGGIYAFALARI